MKAFGFKSTHPFTNVAAEIPLRSKVAYSVGHVANAIKAILFGIFSLYFYTTVMGLPGRLVGMAMAIGLLWDALIDPVIGMVSDRLRGRLGKRHALMLLGSLGMGISFWAFFSPPRGLATPELFGWLLGTSLLVRTMASLYAIPYYALGAELSDDYHERTAITGLRGACALAGAMGTAVLSFVLFFPATTQGGDPKLNVLGYHDMGLFAGLVMTLAGLTSTVFTLSYRQYAKEETTPSLEKPARGFVSGSIRALSNPSFRVIFLSYSLFFLGTVINATLATHFLTYYVGIVASESLSAFHLSFYIGALLGCLFWTKIGKVVEKRHLYFAGTLSAAIILACAYVLLGEGRYFGTGNLQPLLYGHGVAGFFGSVLWIIPASMIADVADEDQMRYGERREGTLFGLVNFGEQIATGASLLISGTLLDRFAGLVPAQAAQTPSTVTRIGVLYSLLPSALLILAAFIILGYGLDKRKVAAIQKKLSGNGELP
jgi:GPH family glycoside/pentoside/hexuronide:cation symporter